MKFGKLFKLLFIFPEFTEDTFTSNKFSSLPHAQLRNIAKTLNKYEYWHSGDYTHFTTSELASEVYNNVRNLYINIGPESLKNRFVPMDLDTWRED